MRNLICISTLFLIAIIGCQKENSASFSEYPAFFQHEYQNSNFPTEHAGWFIDNDGDVKFYQFPVDWVEPDTDGFISAADLTSNLEKADSILYEVPVHHLREMVDLINEIDPDQLTNDNPQPGDTGTASLYYYQWDVEAEKFRRVLVWSHGDRSQINRDKEAFNLIAYLFSIGTEAGFFIQP